MFITQVQRRAVNWALDMICSYSANLSTSHYVIIDVSKFSTREFFYDASVIAVSKAARGRINAPLGKKLSF